MHVSMVIVSCAIGLSWSLPRLLIQIDASLDYDSRDFKNIFSGNPCLPSRLKDSPKHFLGISRRSRCIRGEDQRLLYGPSISRQQSRRQPGRRLPGGLFRVTAQ